MKFPALIIGLMAQSTLIVPLALLPVLMATAGSAGAAPLDRAVLGPKLVCFKYSTFALLDGERVTDFDGSAEAMSISVKGPTGTYEVAESEIFAPPESRGRMVVSRAGTTVYRVAGEPLRYAVFGRPSFSAQKDRLMIWLSGPALQGTTADAAIYGRLRVRVPATVKCEQTFTYSWGF